ncbi:two-component sensor histidine kinase [Enterococcus sp. JM4C]|uniref:HAMP domain-containing sensor histidine kinase n=1 Tax=Candidatus Enterococcus huntleyi TaxID=1857217 RepID=UPI00137ADF26|nr:HAMP domain-containing histidine kinase [Enterococcus sp. JM4C]KAF1297444.1 two-component sensor histidine kinase [Enterococcus sp. JM4C]
MKQSKIKRAEKRELKGPSLTIKWALASSFFIFVVFTIFAVITYKSSVNLIVAKERGNLEKTTAEVVSRLANSEKELTITDTYKNLSNSIFSDGQQFEKTTTIEGTLMQIDPFISELGQEGLSLYVYNLDKELVFETQNRKQKLFQETRKSPTIITLDSKIGFLSIEVIYSKGTREKIGYAQTFYELSSFYEIKNKLLLTLIVLEVVSLILSSVLGFFLSSYFLKPLKELRDTMDTIRKDPQSDIHMKDIKTNDELADLSEIFNEMLDRMRLYIEQQEQFVEDVSHELRTPVAIIEGHLSLLNRWGKDDPEVLEESLNASMQEISRMKSLVQEMLDLSRAEQVDIHYANEVTNAKEVVYQVYNNFKILHPDFVLTLDDDIPEEIQLGIFRNHFEQIIIIILDNAIKYSTLRKEVHISISTSRNEFEIAIQDFGEGISEDDLKKIFNRFYRVDKARARNKGGNGLGLSIAKQLIESYKGTVAAESAVNQGTIFRIFIPIKKK